MTKIHVLPELPPHGLECCSDIVLGWYSDSSFDFMRWFPSSKKWKLVPSGNNIPSHRKVLGWSKLEYPSLRELAKLTKLEGK